MAYLEQSANLSDVPDKPLALKTLADAGGEIGKASVTAPAAPAVHASLDRWLTRDGCLDFRRFVGPTPANGLVIDTALQDAFDEANALPQQSRRILMPAARFVLENTVTSGVNEQSGLVGIPGSRIEMQQTGPGIHVRGQFFRIFNMSFLGNNSGGQCALEFRKNADAPSNEVNVDVDATILNCGFTNFVSSVIFYGRGLLARQSGFGGCTYGFDLHWPESPVGADPDPATGWRAMVVEATRAHAISAVVRGIGVDSQHLRLRLAGTEADVGRALFNGGCSNSEFIDNIMSGADGAVTISIGRGGKGNRFIGNRFSADAATPANRAIRYYGDAVFENVSIDGTFSGYASAPIQSQVGAKNVRIRGNFWGNGTAAPGQYDIEITGSAAGLDVEATFGARATTGGACVRVSGAVDAYSRVTGMKEGGRAMLDAGSISGNPLIEYEPNVYRGTITARHHLAPEFVAHNTRNSSWEPGLQPVGRFVVRTSDTSHAGGPGEAGSFEVHAATAAGDETFAEVKVSGPASRNISSCRFYWNGVGPLADNDKSLGFASARWATVHAVNLTGAFPGPYADDAAAGTAGVPIGGTYRKTGGVLAWRQA
ncbi:hypothetical protein ACFSCV_05630 [Methylopila henanensis]|uniref:Pectate lyase superfamily protein domain-containing protein n=1 Tax=Methylopila henanensis TaxID=873516 RepID=A0ABW4K480_9HYPH